MRNIHPRATIRRRATHTNDYSLLESQKLKPPAASTAQKEHEVSRTRGRLFAGTYSYHTGKFHPISLGGLNDSRASLIPCTLRPQSSRQTLRATPHPTPCALNTLCMRGDAGTRVAVALCAQRHSVCGVCAWVCIAVLFMSPAPSHAWDSPNMPRPPWLRVPLSPRSLALSRTCPLSLAVARSPLSVSPPPPPPPCPT